MTCRGGGNQLLKIVKSSTYKNQHATSCVNKISFTRKKINVEVSRREEATYKKFHEKKISMQYIPRTKKQHAACPRSTKSARNSYHGLNQFHEDKNQCTSFTKIKINAQQVSRILISTQQVPRTKINTKQVQ